MKSNEPEDNSEFGSGAVRGRYGEDTKITVSEVFNRKFVINMTIYIL